MKTLLTAFTALTFISLGGIPSANSAGTDDRGPGKGRAELAPEIRQQFQKARAEALKDPEIQKLQTEARDANQNFFNAIRTKMIEIDPSLKEAVKKMRSGKMGKPGKPDRQEGRKGGQSGQNIKPSGPVAGMGALSADEKAKLKEVRASAQKDPAVQSALEAKKSAKTPEERRNASENYRKAMQAAMLKTDPSVKPLLQKLGPQSRKNPAGRKKKAGNAGDDEMMMDQ